LVLEYQLPFSLRFFHLQQQLETTRMRRNESRKVRTGRTETFERFFTHGSENQRGPDWNQRHFFIFTSKIRERDKMDKGRMQERKTKGTY
jgi:hypothetical protein